jgi:hypothetical protein
LLFPTVTFAVFLVIVLIVSWLLRSRPRMWRLFSDGEGNYSAYLPDSSGMEALVRSSDGIHLTVEGGDRLAARVRDAIAADWPLPEGDE